MTLIFHKVKICYLFKSLKSSLKKIGAYDVLNDKKYKQENLEGA